MNAATPDEQPSASSVVKGEEGAASKRRDPVEKEAVFKDKVQMIKERITKQAMKGSGLGGFEEEEGGKDAAATINNVKKGELD